MNDRGRERMEFKLLEDAVTKRRPEPSPEQIACGHRSFERTLYGNFVAPGRVRAM